MVRNRTKGESLTARVEATMVEALHIVVTSQDTCTHSYSSVSSNHYNYGLEDASSTVILTRPSTARFHTPETL